mmetsp:Transcript_23171/g.32645  ORF Transcript_23171/g.32645 Transcript_23171/m.32645 type:complete len:370 (+) Transcript_23171:483-1592(+)
MILKTTPVASSTGASRRGLDIAAIAASSADVLPMPVPIPIRAVPASCMTLRTSAKSTLMRPGLTIISEIPTTPCLRISSATRKDASRGVFSGMMSNNLLLETTITVSTFCLSLSMASVACRILLLPSKAKGLVTMATVRAPDSFAISETTGAAPDPVPPPMPLVTKHRSVPATMAAISSLDSSAASLPTSGSPPAPSPLVTEDPMLRTCAPFAFDRPRACASVLMAQNSTPWIRVSSIRSTAFVPPPPTPQTLITHGLRPPSGIRGEKELFCSIDLRRNPFSLRNPRNLPCFPPFRRADSSSVWRDAEDSVFSKLSSPRKESRLRNDENNDVDCEDLIVLERLLEVFASQNLDCFTTLAGMNDEECCAQ